MDHAPDRALAARVLVHGALAVAIAAVIAACTLNPSPTGPSTTTNPAGTPGASTSSTGPSATVTEPTPIPTPPGESPSAASCAAVSLAARVTVWDSAAGSRIAHVELTNKGSTACSVPGLLRADLVDGGKDVLIHGAPVAATAPVVVAAGATVSTDVRVANYCGPDAVPPVTISFELPASAGTVVAAPVSPVDRTGVPPCSGSTVPGTVEMQPWT